MTVIEKLDSEVEDKVQELKKRFVNDMKHPIFENDYTFYRFLKARDFNLDQAETMLRKHLEWRKEFKADTILTEKNIISEELASYCPHCIFGFDKEHSPVKFFAYGNMDTKGIRMSAKFIDRVRYTLQITEEEINILEKQSKKIGKNIVGSVYIIDMKNFSFATATDKHTIEDTIYLARMYQDNYPERLKSVYFLNVSSYFSIAYAMVKNFIAPSILEKVHIYAGPEEWQPELLKIIDADVLPAFLGGNRTDPDGDPMCKSFVRHGGIVPTSLYIHKSKNPLSKSKGAKKLVVPRASFSEIELDVKEAGSMIEWEFETKSRDIGFGLFLKEIEKDGEEKITELVPLLRLDTDEYSEAGMYKCEKAGIYVILFDNSYSWVRSKEIYYRAIVVSPKQHEDEMLS